MKKTVALLIIIVIAITSACSYKINNNLSINSESGDTLSDVEDNAKQAIK